MWGLLNVCLLVALALLVALTTSRSDSLLRKGYDRIRVGMTPGEVAREVIRDPASTVNKLKKAQIIEEERVFFQLVVSQHKSWMAGDDTEQIRVDFDDNLRVRSKQYRSGVMLRVARWLDELRRRHGW
jgi:hypothetical protein